MGLRPELCVVEVSGLGVCVVAGTALEKAAQVLKEFCLSVFFASMSSWGYCCFNEGFSADYCEFGFFAYDVFCK